MTRRPCDPTTACVCTTALEGLGRTWWQQQRAVGHDGRRPCGNLARATVWTRESMGGRAGSWRREGVWGEAWTVSTHYSSLRPSDFVAGCVPLPQILSPLLPSGSQLPQRTLSHMHRCGGSSRVSPPGVNWTVSSPAALSATTDGVIAGQPGSLTANNIHPAHLSTYGSLCSLTTCTTNTRIGAVSHVRFFPHIRSFGPPVGSQSLHSRRTYGQGASGAHGAHTAFLFTEAFLG